MWVLNFADIFICGRSRFFHNYEKHKIKDL